MKLLHTIGRRKTSIVRLYISLGNGKIIVNNRDYKEYFTKIFLKYKILQPFILTNNIKKYNVRINVNGGGVNSQVEAIRLAISRALCSIENEYVTNIKEHGLLSRDPRKVERKKFGKRKARKKFQFSKR
jgi:small subunit ribosomal protein S9